MTTRFFNSYLLLIIVLINFCLVSQKWRHFCYVYFLILLILIYKDKFTGYVRIFLNNWAHFRQVHLFGNHFLHVFKNNRQTFFIIFIVDYNIFVICRNYKILSLELNIFWDIWGQAILIFIAPTFFFLRTVINVYFFRNVIRRIVSL